MAITVILDTVEQAALDYSFFPAINPTRFIRPCVIEGIDVSGSGNKSEALWLAGEAVAAAELVAPLTTARSAGMSRTRLFLEPVSDTKARGRILYETFSFSGATPSTYLIRDSAYTRSMETNRLPGTHAPLNCTWTGTSYGSTASTSISITDRILFTILAPMRTIITQALIFGSPAVGGSLVFAAPPPIGGSEAISLVNDATWPTSSESGLYPKPKGYWLLQKYETAISRYSGYYTIEAQATTKVIEDWSDTGTLRNAQTGRYVKIDESELATVLSAAYTYGRTPGNGFLRVGFYPLINFSAIFGF